MSDDTALGPLDFVLIEFPDGVSTTPVATALTEVLDRGIVRLFDIAAVRRMGEATTRVDLARGTHGLDGFAAFAGAESGLFDASDIDLAGEALEPGTTGLMLAFENTWAGGFVAAAHAAGGRVVAADRIPAQALLDALDEIEKVDGVA